MIITNLRGGLGNQMFQYAFGRALATRLNTQLYLDIRNFEITQVRRYGLDRFSISGCVSPEEYLPPDRRSKRFAYYRWRYSGKFPRFVRERGLSYNKSTELIDGNAYLHGYWPSEMYFKEYDELIRNEFRLLTKPYPISEKMLKQITNEVSVSLHVRRGDYLTQKIRKRDGSCSFDYYKSALTYIISKIGQTPVVYIFSDDQDWVRKEFRIEAETVIVDAGNVEEPHEDLRLMIACEHNIIANSTFSWWGGWLNSNPQKIVVAPSNWFIDHKVQSCNIVPESWHKI